MKATMKKVLSMVLVVALVASASIIGTMAYLTTDAGDEKNVFSVGNIDISLDEEVGVYGEGGEVKETEDGAEYIEVMPGDYLKKKVTVTNNGKTDAYVAVTVTLNNASEINEAIDEVYGDGNKGGQAMYDFIFDGWGINQNPRPGAYGNDARGVIDGEYGLPDHVLHVDFAKTTKGSTVIGANNWFIAGREKAGQYWVDGPAAEYDGYYTKNMEDYEICYTYYIYLPAGESTTLFNGLNVPAEFTNAQMAMFDGLEINVEAKAIQADNMAIADQYKNDENGKAKTAFAILAGDIETPEYSSKPSGTTSIVGYTDATRIWGENGSNAKISHVIKLYSGDTYLGETSLQQDSGYIDGDVYVTWSMPLSGETDCWDVTWVQKPTLELQPTRIELWVDGELIGQGNVQLSGPDNLNSIVGAVINSDGEILRYVVKGSAVNVKDGETYVPFVSSDEEFASAISGGVTEVWLNSGTYHVPSAAKGKTLTINGTKDAVLEVVPAGQGEANGQLDYNFDGSTVTFNGITIKTNSKTYAGYTRLTGTYNNCTIDGHYSLQRDSKFINCTLNVSGDQYNVWTWGAPNVTFDGCTFNCDGKAILVYNQSCNLTVNNCVFNDSSADPNVGGKAAIEACNGDSGKNCVTHNITITNTTVNGFDVTSESGTSCGGTSLGTTLWGNKNLLDGDHLNVTVDGIDVY